MNDDGMIDYKNNMDSDKDNKVNVYFDEDNNDNK